MRLNTRQQNQQNHVKVLDYHMISFNVHSPFTKDSLLMHYKLQINQPAIVYQLLAMNDDGSLQLAFLLLQKVCCKLDNVFLVPSQVRKIGC